MTGINLPGRFATDIGPSLPPTLELENRPSRDKDEAIYNMAFLANSLLLDTTAGNLSPAETKDVTSRLDHVLKQVTYLVATGASVDAPSPYSDAGTVAQMAASLHRNGQPALADAIQAGTNIKPELPVPDDSPISRMGVLNYIALRSAKQLAKAGSEPDMNWIIKHSTREGVIGSAAPNLYLSALNTVIETADRVSADPGRAATMSKIKGNALTAVASMEVSFTQQNNIPLAIAAAHILIDNDRPNLTSAHQHPET